MKRQLLVAGVALALATSVAGCGGSPAAPPSDPPPPGFVRVKDGGKIGDTIYSRTGFAVGIMERLDSQHRFPNGNVEMGVLVKMSDGESRWMNYSVVQNGFFVKTP